MTLRVMNNIFAVFGQCPLLTRKRPNCCITASDVTGHQATLAYFIEPEFVRQTQHG